MSKTKYLALSVVFAITYIACDLSYVFYVADKTETTVGETHNSAAYQNTYKTMQQHSYALNSASRNNIKPTDANTAIVE